MASDLSDGPAIHPMVEEREATGTVAGVYAALLTRMPFVPSLFEPLELCPPYLLLAVEQAAGVLDGDELQRSGEDLGASVRDVVQPPEQEQVRRTRASFVGPLGRMLPLSGGLLLALEGELDDPPAPGDALPVRPVQREQAAPSQWEAAGAEALRRDPRRGRHPGDRPMWRQLTAAGQLEQTWATFGPQVEASRPAADDLQRRALAAARRLPWTVVADRTALERSGTG